MPPAVPRRPALLVAGPAQYARQVRFQGAEEDEVLGPRLVLVAGVRRGGVPGLSQGGWRRSVSEEEIGSRTEGWGAEFAGEPGGWVGVELVGFVEVGGARLAGGEV